ncbi:MAG: hypothetical protein Q4C55_01170 [Eubacterium sp.]|nr:hypothetical protein [Eubacterium sp.]
MAVKAREEVRSQGFSLTAMILIFLFVLGYVLFYNRIINAVGDYNVRTAISFGALILMFLLCIIVLRFITTKYYMVLTHKNLSISRKIFFWEKEILVIPVSAMTQVLPAESAAKAPGKNKNLTLARIENKAKYLVYYTQDKQTNAVKIQCSSKFHRELAALIK